MAVKINLKGQTFGLWTVLKEAPSKKYNTYWLCKCQCGIIRAVSRDGLCGGGSKSCGCFRKINYSGKNNPCWTGYNDLSGSHWAIILNNAKTRKIKVLITIKEAWNKFIQQKGKCALSGVPLQFSKRRQKMNKDTTASLDRIDSSKGYILDNIQWIHKKINFMKQKMPQKEFIDICKNIANYNS
jgi:hypothetical protein